MNKYECCISTSAKDYPREIIQCIGANSAALKYVRAMQENECLGELKHKTAIVKVCQLETSYCYGITVECYVVPTYAVVALNPI
jgi:hypothetical protein